MVWVDKLKTSKKDCGTTMLSKLFTAGCQCIVTPTNALTTIEVYLYRVYILATVSHGGASVVSC